MSFRRYKTRYEILKKVLQLKAKAKPETELEAQFIDQARESLKDHQEMTPFEFTKGLVLRAIGGDTDLSQSNVHIGVNEALWWHENRPYYNLFPSVEEMFGRMSLDVKPEEIVFPFPTICIQMPESSPTPITGLLCSSITDKDLNMMDGPADKEVGRQLSLVVQWTDVDSGRQYDFTCGFGVDDPVNRGKTVEGILAEDFFADISNHPAPVEDLIYAFRIALGTALISSNAEMVTRVVLNKDKERYAVAGEELKRRLEAKAEKVHRGIGFNVGEELESKVARGEIAPHIRKPHLAVVHTGPGRSVPKVVLRTGKDGGAIVVNRDKIEKVPTGYLGADGDTNDIDQ